MRELMTNVTGQGLNGTDVLLINDAIARYNRGIDTGDRAEFLSVFTDSATWESPMMGTFEGKEAIAAWFDDFYSTPSPYHNGQHWVTNLIFENVKSAEVELWSNFIFVSATGSGGRISVVGSYRDLLVEEEGRWLFQRRSIELVSMA